MELINETRVFTLSKITSYNKNCTIEIAIINTTYNQFQYRSALEIELLCDWLKDVSLVEKRGKLFKEKYYSRKDSK